MNRPVRPSPPPSGAPAPGAAEAEESQITVRSPKSESALLRARMASAPFEVSSHDRLEAKLRLGRQLLSEISAADEHARLLSVALMRRDEALLDGVLAALARRGR